MLVPDDGRLVPPPLPPIPARRYFWRIMIAPGVRVPPLVSWRVQSVLVIAGIWTALGLMSAAGVAVALGQMGRPAPWGPVVLDRLADWYTCAVFTPVFVWLTRRWPLERGAWARRLPGWMVLTAACVPLKNAGYWGLALVLPTARAFPSYRQLLARSFAAELIVFWAIVAVVHGIEFYQRLRERELHATALRGELAEARLEALNAQLRPHFLFNTLQGISTLLQRDAGAADQMLARLSDLLRRSLARTDRQVVSLREELEALDDYVAIQRARFADRLTVELHVPDEALGAEVPHFTLQPLVENAIEHGLARRAGAGRIVVTARRDDGRLRVSVSDDGEGLGAAGGFPPEGIGLGNTRRRLEALYGAAASLSLAPGVAGGLTVSLDLPFRNAA